MTVDIASFPKALHSTLTSMNKDIEFKSAAQKGANGHVIFGLNNVLNRIDVIKLYYWENGDHAEPELLAKLEHPNILKVYHAASVDDDWAYYTTKHCDGGDLDGLLAARQLGLNEALEMTTQVTSGVSYLHANSYLHRDLKPENIYIDGTNTLIGDFGSVAPCDANGYCKTFTRHSLIYRPPEALVTNDHFKTSDVYQLGLLLYQLCGGHFPYHVRDWLNDKQKAVFDGMHGFVEKNDYADGIIEKRIAAGRLLDFDSLPAFVPTSIKNIIRKATRVNRAQRYNGAAEFLAVLHNKRGQLPDWKIEDDYFVLYRRRKTIRIKENGTNVTIEKNVGSGWRNHNSTKANNLRDAVIIAEML